MVERWRSLEICGLVVLWTQHLCNVLREFLQYSTNIHLDSRLNGFDFCGQRSRSVWPHCFDRHYFGFVTTISQGLLRENFNFVINVLLNPRMNWFDFGGYRPLERDVSRLSWSLVRKVKVQGHGDLMCLWRPLIRNVQREFCDILNKHSLGLKDQLARIWWAAVKGQDHCDR